MLQILLVETKLKGESHAAGYGSEKWHSFLVLKVVISLDWRALGLAGL